MIFNLGGKLKYLYVCYLCSENRSVVTDSLRPHGLYSPWNSPGENNGGGSIPFSRGSSQPRDLTQVSCITGRFFTSWATREALYVCWYCTNSCKFFHLPALWLWESGFISPSYRGCLEIYSREFMGNDKTLYRHYIIA